jgi:hypothetical protein
MMIPLVGIGRDALAGQERHGLRVGEMPIDRGYNRHEDVIGRRLSFGPIPAPAMLFGHHKYPDRDGGTAVSRVPGMRAAWIMAQHLLRRKADLVASRNRNPPSTSVVQQVEHEPGTIDLLPGK